MTWAGLRVAWVRFLRIAAITLGGPPMMTRDALCSLCDRVVLAEDALLHLCAGCNAIVCDEHSGEPSGVHDPEDHISPADVDDAEEPLAVAWSGR
jgi:hypothetical protein